MTTQNINTTNTNPNTTNTNTNNNSSSTRYHSTTKSSRTEYSYSGIPVYWCTDAVQYTGCWRSQYNIYWVRLPVRSSNVKHMVWYNTLNGINMYQVQYWYQARVDGLMSWRYIWYDTYLPGTTVVWYDMLQPVILSDTVWCWLIRLLNGTRVVLLLAYLENHVPAEGELERRIDGLGLSSKIDRLLS